MERSRFSRIRSLARPAVLGIVVLGCSENGLDPVGPGTSSASGYHFVLLDGDTLQGYAGDSVEGARVLVLGPDSLPATGVLVGWQVLKGGGRVDQTSTRTDGSGLASTTWFLGVNVATLQVLRLKVSDWNSVLLYARPGLPPIVTLSRDTSLAIDTIGTLLNSPLQLRVQLPDGRPIEGALVDFAVTRGGGRLTLAIVATGSDGPVEFAKTPGSGRLPQQTVTTLFDGIAAMGWQLGDTAGVQEVVATIRAAAGDPGSQHTFRAVSLPGRPTEMASATDTIRFDALQDTVLPAVVVRDRAGNDVVAAVDWSSLTPAIVGGLSSLGITSLQNGVGQVAAQLGPLRATIPVVVSQRPAGVRRGRDSVSLHWIGASAQLDADVVDRRGVMVPGLRPVWRGLAAHIAAVDSSGMVGAVANGSARVVAEFNGFGDTVTVGVEQLPAAITVFPALDTMNLDEVRTPAAAVLDSGGTPISSAGLAVTVSDSSVIVVDAGGALRATQPGLATLTYSAGPVRTSIQRVVEGVAILWDGQRMLSPGVLAGHPPFVITNGRVRISWSTAMWELGSVAMEVRLGATWHPASSPHYGDWLYITSSIITLPTQVELVENTQDRVGLRLRYDDHWFLPQNHGFPATYVAKPYPFVRTLWLGKGDNGYYSWVDDLTDPEGLLLEHETGFGGLWGPATIRTAKVDLRTDTLQRTVTHNGDPGIRQMGSAVDAAEFVIDGDPVRRVLVPVPAAPFITPVFLFGYGSIYRYAGPPMSFGVYMYATGLGSGPPVPTICRGAWLSAPFPLPAVSDAQLAGCGPPGP